MILARTIAGGFGRFAVRQGKRAVAAGTASMGKKYELTDRRDTTFRVFVQDGGPFQRALEIADRVMVCDEILHHCSPVLFHPLPTHLRDGPGSHVLINRTKKLPLVASDSPLRRDENQHYISWR